MDSPTGDAPAPDPIRFRGKKRKTYRQRTTDSAEDVAESNVPAAIVPEPSAAAAGEPSEQSDQGDGESAVAAAIRLRNARKARLRGVGFRSEAKQDEGANMEQGMVLREQGEKEVMGGMTDRFTHQTGLINDLNDRHMTAYIESRLSSRKARASALHPQGELSNTTTNAGSNSSTAAAPAPGTEAQAAGESAAKMRDQPTKHGRLLEVDVPGDDTWDRGGPKKRRANESAQPARPPRRQRNRRNSDDVKRDQLVDQFLHENRLDVYDVPAPSTQIASVPDEDGGADERLAEQFRQQYLDDLAQRRKKKRAPAPTRQQQPVGDVLKGPKLGGSRNSRAAVRDMLLKQEKEKGGR